MKCLIHFAQVHEEFRLPELFSVAKILGIDLVLNEADVSRPYLMVDLLEEHAKALARRCILIKSVLELYAYGQSYDEVHEMNQRNRHLWEHHVEDSVFKFNVQAYNHTIPNSRKKAIIEHFSYMDWKGDIDVNNPQVVLTAIEEYAPKGPKTWQRHENDGKFRQAYFGRLIEEGSARELIHKFDVKKRNYFGNTSMDAEMSLLMANQALATPGKILYDPFAGTGSMLYTAAHFEALVFGSDIDGRQMRGKELTPGVHRSAEQYGIRHKILDLATFDMTRHPWRAGNLFDGIVTDPPYGVRAGAKRLGRRPRKGDNTKETFPQTAPAYVTQPGYVPPTKPYELSHLANDLVLYSRYLLKPGGRLVYFLPTVNDDYSEVDIPVCEGMSLISNSLQDFGNWGRRLVTMEKITDAAYPPPRFLEQLSPPVNAVQAPAHKDFRVKYFAGFQKEPTSKDNETST